MLKAMAAEAEKGGSVEDAIKYGQARIRYHGGLFCR